MYYRFDENGYYVEQELKEHFVRLVNPRTVTDEFGNERVEYDEESYIPDDLTEVQPPGGLYRAKWTGATGEPPNTWIETGEPPEPPEPPELPPGQLSQDEIAFVRGMYDGAGGGDE